MRDIENGDRVAVKMIEIKSDRRPHIDTPLRLIPGGSIVTDISLDTAVGPSHVIEITETRENRGRSTGDLQH